MRKTTRRSKKVEELLYSRFKGNRATLYGPSKEDITRQQYITYQQQNGHFGLETQQSGLVISCDNHWLAASPDDRVNDPSSVQSQSVAEYKNPFAAKDLTLEEACDKINAKYSAWRGVDKMANKHSNSRSGTIITSRCSVKCIVVTSIGVTLYNIPTKSYMSSVSIEIKLGGTNSYQSLKSSILNHFCLSCLPPDMAKVVSESQPQLQKNSLSLSITYLFQILYYITYAHIHV